MLPSGGSILLCHQEILVFTDGTHSRRSQPRDIIAEHSEAGQIRIGHQRRADADYCIVVIIQTLRLLHKRSKVSHQRFKDCTLETMGRHLVFFRADIQISGLDKVEL